MISGYLKNFWTRLRSRLFFSFVRALTRLANFIVNFFQKSLKAPKNAMASYASTGSIQNIYNVLSKRSEIRYDMVV